MEIKFHHEFWEVGDKPFSKLRVYRLLFQIYFNCFFLLFVKYLLHPYSVHTWIWMPGDNRWEMNTNQLLSQRNSPLPEEVVFKLRAVGRREENDPGKEVSSAKASSCGAG
jgi:hypothetical protein